MITMSSPFGSGFFGSGGFGSLLPSAKDVARKKALAAAAKKLHPAVAAKIVAASRTGDPALQKLAAQIGALNAQAKVARSAGNTTLANQIDTMTAGLQKKMAAIAATKAVAVKAAVAKAVPTPLPAPVAKALRAKLTKKVKARTAMKAAVVAKAVAASIPQAVRVDPTTAKRLQAALVVLGKIAGSAQLKAVKVDGAPGAKTAAAVNLAFTRHIGAGQAPAQYRTGKLPLDYIKANATVLTGILEAEIKRRGGLPVPASTVKKSQPVSKGSATAAAKKALAAKTKAAKASTKKTAAAAKLARLKAAATAKRAQAAAIRATNPALAAKLDAQAASDEAGAGGAGAEATVAAQDESAAAGEAQAAASEAQDIATMETKADAAQSAATEAAVSQLSPSEAALIPGGPTEASMLPSGGFIDKYKWPLLGGVGLLGLLAVMMNKRPAGARPPSAKPASAPAMSGARRRRRYRGRR